MARKSVTIIILLLFFLLIAGFMIFIVFGNMPDVVVDILFPEKTKLVRYYACSLAMCTKGCGDGMLWDLTNPDGFICLENDTESPATCELPCESLCPSPGIKCGRNNPIILELKGKGFLGGVPLKGVYDVHWGMKPIVITLGIITQPMSIIIPPMPELMTCNIFSEAERLVWAMQKTDYPSFPSPGDIVDDPGVFGGIYDLSSDWRGQGAIFLNPEVARSAFGCFKQSPYAMLASTFCGGDYGFHQCKFQGKLYFWGKRTSPGKADVMINATPPEPGFFTVWVSPDNWKGTINGQAVYGITITNYLDTGAGFGVDVYDTTPGVDLFTEPAGDPVCEICVDSTCSSGPISMWINDTDIGFAELRLRCMVQGPTPNPDFLKKHIIRIDVDTIGEPPYNGFVTFEVVDFDIDVYPGAPTGPDQVTKKIGERTNILIDVWSYFNDPETFDLSYEFRDSSGGLTTNVDCDPLDATVTVPAQTPAGPGRTTLTMSCGSDVEVEDTYTITVYASDGGYAPTKWDSTTLIVEFVDCECNAANDGCDYTPCRDCDFCEDETGPKGICQDSQFYGNVGDTNYCCLEDGSPTNPKCVEYGCEMGTATYPGVPVCKFEAGCISVGGVGECQWEEEPCGSNVDFGRGPGLDLSYECEQWCEPTGCQGCGCKPTCNYIGSGGPGLACSEDLSVIPENCCGRAANVNVVNPQCELAGKAAVCKYDGLINMICLEGKTYWPDCGVQDPDAWCQYCRPYLITGYWRYTAGKRYYYDGRFPPCVREEDCPDYFCTHNKLGGGDVYYKCRLSVNTADWSCYEGLRCNNYLPQFLSFAQCYYGMTNEYELPSEYDTLDDCLNDCKDWYEAICT